MCAKAELRGECQDRPPKHEESGKGRQERKRSKDELLTSRRDLELLDAVGPDGGENYRHFREWVGVDGGESEIIRVSASSQAVAESEARGIRGAGELYTFTSSVPGAAVV